MQYGSTILYRVCVHSNDHLQAELVVRRGIDESMMT